MRAAVIGLVTIPVIVAGGLGIAAAVGVFSAPSPDASGSGEVTTAASSSPSVSVRDLTGGTAIDGTKPHLTVIDGRATLMLPGALPAIFSVLPRRPVDLMPLPTDASLLTEHANRTVGKTPDTHTFDVTRPQYQGPPPVTGSEVWALPPAHAAGEAAQAPPQVGGPQPDLRRGSGGQSGTHTRPGIDPSHSAPDISAPDTHAPHTHAPGRPAHADQTGRPGHAGQPGRPDHAGNNGNGNSGNSGNRGNGDAGNRDSDNSNSGNRRPDHAGQPGRPSHADNNRSGNSGNRGHGHGYGHGDSRGAESNRSLPR